MQSPYAIGPLQKKILLKIDLLNSNAYVLSVTFLVFGTRNASIAVIRLFSAMYLVKEPVRLLDLAFPVKTLGGGHCKAAERTDQETWFSANTKREGPLPCLLP